MLKRTFLVSLLCLGLTNTYAAEHEGTIVAFPLRSIPCCVAIKIGKLAVTVTTASNTKTIDINRLPEGYFHIQLLGKGIEVDNSNPITTYVKIGRGAPDTVSLNVPSGLSFDIVKQKVHGMSRFKVTPQTATVNLLSEGSNASLEDLLHVEQPTIRRRSTLINVQPATTIFGFDSMYDPSATIIETNLSAQQPGQRVYGNDEDGWIERVA